jgi:hypothetical protein
MGQLLHTDHRENGRAMQSAPVEQSAYAANRMPQAACSAQRVSEERVENWIADAILASGYLLISLAILAVIYLVAQMLGYAYPLLVQAG